MAEPRTQRAEAARPPAWWRQALRSFAELLAVSGLAVTQPLLDVFELYLVVATRGPGPWPRSRGV